MQATDEDRPEFELTPFVPPPDEPASAVVGQVDLFGPVEEALSLQDVQKAIRGISRPRDLRPLVQKSTHDPLMNMLELAMQAKQAGMAELAFSRFAECLPYIWTKVHSQGLAAVLEGANPQGTGEVVYRWHNPDDGQQR